MQDPTIDAAVVATPVTQHHPISKKLLEAGKHVLVEKPMASSIVEAEDLIETADRRGLVLMTGHTFLYTAAVNKMICIRSRY